MNDKLSVNDLRKIKGYDDIKEYIYKQVEETESEEEKRVLRRLIYDIYECDIGLCGWID